MIDMLHNHMITYDNCKRKLRQQLYELLTVPG